MIAVMLTLATLKVEAPPAPLVEAARLYASGDCAAAAAMYEPIVAVFPDLPALGLNYSRCLAGAGRKGEALLAATSALKQDPSDWRAWRLWLRLRVEAAAPVTAEEWLLWSARLANSTPISAAVLACLVVWWWRLRVSTAPHCWHAILLAWPMLWWLGVLTQLTAPAWFSPQLVVIRDVLLRAGNGWSYPPAPWLGQRANLANGAVVRLRTAADNGWIQVVCPDGRIGWLPATVTVQLP